MKGHRSLTNLEALLDGRGEITIGSIGPIPCVATASDEDMTYVMLQRRPGEPLGALLDRLDATLAWAWENEELVDEINPQNPAPKPAPAAGRPKRTAGKNKRRRLAKSRPMRRGGAAPRRV